MTDVWASPKRFEDVFAQDIHKRIYEFLCQPGWETGWKSNSKHDGYSFLHKHFAGRRKTKTDDYDCEDELQKGHSLIHEAWLSTKEKIFAGHTLIRCYANGMAYGMDGTVHTDSNDPGNYTAVYYPHERWSPNWGGETMFYNRQESRVIACSYPIPNSVVVFDGRMPHRANGLSRSYTGMRITLMFKTATEKPNAPAV